MSMVTITIKLPKAYVEALDELVRKGRFTSRSEAIRFAIHELLIRESLLDGNDNNDGWDNGEEVESNFR